MDTKNTGHWTIGQLQPGFMTVVTLLILLAPSLAMATPYANSQSLLTAQALPQAPINLVQQGTGVYQIRGQGVGIIRASVAVRTDGRADVSFRLSDDRLMQLNGELINRDAYSMSIRLTHSGMASAMGVANIFQGEGQAIERIEVDGTVDGQNLVVSFSQL